MKYFVLMYDVVNDFISDRAQFREAHLKLVKASTDKGELIMGGALGKDPVVGALIIFKATDASVVEDFARNDPYVINGLVNDWRVLPWAAVEV